MTEAALFDLDGTLVRTHIDFAGLREALDSLARRAGVTSLDDDLLAIRAALPPQLQPEAEALIESWEERGCAAPERIIGANALLEELRQQGIGIGIVTRNGRRLAQQLLASQRLPYDILIAREDSPRPKPFPEPILLACAHLGVRPDQAVMVGDYWPDIASGRAAGVGLTIGIQWPHDPPDRFARSAPDLLVGSLEEAATHLRSCVPPHGAARYAPARGAFSGQAAGADPADRNKSAVPGVACPSD